MKLTSGTLIYARFLFLGSGSTTGCWEVICGAGNIGGESAEKNDCGTPVTESLKLWVGLKSVHLLQRPNTVPGAYARKEMYQQLPNREQVGAQTILVPARTYV